MKFGAFFEPKYKIIRKSFGRMKENPYLCSSKSKKMTHTTDNLFGFYYYFYFSR